MAEAVPDANEQVLQHFLSNSPWDANAVMTQVAMRSNDALQDGEDRCLLIDETSFIKKGTDMIDSCQENNFHQPNFFFKRCV